MIKRIYVERKPGHDIEAQCLYRDLKENLGIGGIKKLRLLKRFDVEGITEEEYLLAKNTVFSQSQVDITYDEKAPIDNCRHFEMELLPGQYDQQADFSAQCLQILTMGKKPNVRTGTLIVLEGNITDKQLDEIKKYCINPVESREVSTKKPATLKHEYKAAKEIKVLDGFIEKNEDELNDFISELGLAMDLEDLKFCQAYFRDTEKRNPTITEIRVLDTYWSDHCRHSTFLTELCDIKINDNKIQEVFQDYLKHKDPNKPVCLMDMATSSIKRLKAEGKLDNLDDSEEINASSIEVMADIDGKKEPWLIMFKNETHNHPTEIEPFGGASTCLGGAIRDPLSGRSYVYQSMRVTGSGDPRKKISETLKGKLPQRVITKVATKGFSSYGNQIGLATGQGTEIYDEGYIAKRMELGAVIAAAPKENVIRKTPSPGDVIILLGGRTGRDGCGGATSSSKAHDETSLEVCGAEVQRGNPSEERKIVRLFRKKEVTTLIKKCNDFGAGGVSVAIGELADGLFINLDAVPKKYEGLDGTELAISESQERMAVVVAPENADKFIEYAKEENLEATIIAKVTKSPRLVMQFGGKTIVDISREFLNTNGTRKKAAAEVPPANAASFFKQREATDIKKEWLDTLSSLRQCSQKGLVEHFDSTIGRGTILLPFGGKAQLTPAQVMAAKLPVLNQNTNTATIMSFGYNPVLFKQSPFHGAVYSLVEAASKVVASGGNLSNIRFTLQEYFERLGDDPKRWGKPVAALLGAYYAQIKMGLASIGGKDSMSGSFLDIDVPPTLVAFAVCPTDAREIISNEFKAAGHKLVLVAPRYDNNNLPDFEDLKDKYEKINKLIKSGKVYSANAIGQDGAFELAKATFGNKIGMKLDKNSDLFKPLYGAIVLEVDEEIGFGEVIGETIDDENIICGTAKITIDEAIKVWKQPLEDIYPSEYEKVKYPKLSYANRSAIKSASTFAKPTVFIPIFPETNCEYDSAVAFEKAGAKIETFVMKNLSPEDIKYSVDMISKHIRQSQIVMLAGGYSAGDEPGGSSKFAVTVFKNEKVKDAINDLLKNRDGLILGIGSGFQALLRLGLVPFGEIREMDDTCPTLTYNTIGRHISCMVKTRVASVLSPWFADFNVGDESWIPISHGEGRFVASDEMVQKLIENGQIATQYVDINPNGSVYVIEGITSPDGRILGKMGHNERIDENIAINIPGNKGQNIYLSGVNYFK